MFLIMVSSVRFNFKTFFLITNFKTLKKFRSVKFTAVLYYYILTSCLRLEK